jgi:alkanesulfonate monooxygenase SsuD/methylene tetrahydromethanopterin reductase-like flavin-dependent oxidoreductase (luciferase family)
MAALRRGVSLPTFGPLAGPEAVAHIARTADDLGFHSVSSTDRLLLPADAGPLGQACHTPRPVWDCIEMLTWAAAHTTRVRLATTVVHALFQPPVVLARRLATLDQLSGGRLDVGVGQGWTPHEHESAGVPMASRAEALAEHVELMRRCWEPGRVSYQGRHYQLRSSWIEPKPAQPRLPVYIAAVTPQGIAQAAAIADGFMYAVTTWSSAAEAVRWYREAGGQGPIALRLNPIRDSRAGALDRFAEVLSTDVAEAVGLGAAEVHWEMNQSSMTLTEQCKAMALITELT